MHVPHTEKANDLNKLKVENESMRVMANEKPHQESETELIVRYRCNMDGMGDSTIYSQWMRYCVWCMSILAVSYITCLFLRY